MSTDMRLLDKNNRTIKNGAECTVDAKYIPHYHGKSGAVRGFNTASVNGMASVAFKLAHGKTIYIMPDCLVVKPPKIEHAPRQREMRSNSHIDPMSPNTPIGDAFHELFSREP